MLSLAFACGIWLADGGWASSASARAAALAFLALGSLPRLSSRSRACFALLLATASGVVAMSWRLESAALHAPSAIGDRIVEGRICHVRVEESWFEADLCRAAGVDGEAAPVPPRIRITQDLQTQAGHRLTPWLSGQVIRARLRLRGLTASGNPGVRDRSRALARRGVGARASLVDPRLSVRLSERDHPLGTFFSAGWRKVAAVRSESGSRLSGWGRGGDLLRALALGDRSALTAEQREAFARLGVAHLLAVSGLHVMLVAGLGFGVSNRLLRRSVAITRRYDVRKVSFAAALVIAGVYGVMAGWGVPVRRAFFFLGIAGLALASGRSPSAVQILGLAALPLMIAEPALIFDLGAQLSFLASAALMLARPARDGQATGILAVVSGLLRTSATAIAVTAPLLAWNGIGAGAWGLASNLALIPWTGLVLLPCAIVSAILVWLPELPPASLSLGVCSGIAGKTLEIIDLSVSLLPAKVPGPGPHWLSILIAASIATAGLFMRATWRRVAIAMGVCWLLSVAPRSQIRPEPPRVVSFDVGQGDATLIQGRKASLLVDAGRALEGSFDQGRRIVVPGLAALGVERLDLLAVSHADLDHRGGVPAVLRSFPVTELWLPHGGASDPDFSEILELARSRGVRVRERGMGDPSREIGDLRITPLWPRRRPMEGSRRNRRNAGSLVLRVEIMSGEGRSPRVLLTGDVGVLVEDELRASGQDLRADVLKVGHHGSRGSSSLAFLEAVAPALALVSAPCQGRGGLPSREALERIESVGTKVWWTGYNGAVLVGLGGPSRAPEVHSGASGRSCRRH